MPGSCRHRSAERPDHGDLGFETIVIGQVEAQYDRTRCRSPLDHIEPDEFTTTVDQQMFAARPAHHACVGRKRVEEQRAHVNWLHSPYREDAWVNGRRPHRQNGGAALVRVFRESAAPSARRSRHQLPRQSEAALAAENRLRDRPDRAGAPPTQARDDRGALWLHGPRYPACPPLRLSPFHPFATGRTSLRPRPGRDAAHRSRADDQERDRQGGSRDIVLRHCPGSDDAGHSRRATPVRARSGAPPVAGRPAIAARRVSASRGSS